MQDRGAFPKCRRQLMSGHRAGVQQHAQRPSCIKCRPICTNARLCVLTFSSTPTNTNSPACWILHRSHQRSPSFPPSKSGSRSAVAIRMQRRSTTAFSLKHSPGGWIAHQVRL